MDHTIIVDVWAGSNHSHTMITTFARVRRKTKTNSQQPVKFFMVFLIDKMTESLRKQLFIS